MQTPGTDLRASLQVLGDLARATAFPANPREICHQGLSILSRALGAAAGLACTLDAEGRTHLACTVGEGPERDMLEEAEAFVRTREPRRITEAALEGGTPRRVTLLVLVAVDREPSGVMVFERPAAWNGEVEAFAESAARILASAFVSAQKLQISHQQGDLLARRNVELEILRELAGAMQEAESEEAVLELSLDLTLRKLGLTAGWIFWGETSTGRLELAAARGVSEAFIDRSKRSGIGTCLCLDVFDTGRLCVARNTTDCPRLPELVRGTESMTHACIPLKFERGTLGVMNLVNRPGQSFSPAELQFLEILGNQICLSVDKLRTGAAEARRNAESRALVSLARAIGGSLDLEKVLAAVSDYARSLLAADRCAIFLGDGGTELEYAHLSGAPLEGLAPGARVNFTALGASAILDALATRHTLVIQDIRDDPRVNQELAARWGIGSEILIPLVARDRVQGLLMAGRVEASAWTPEEAALADALATQATVAIENARLFRETNEALDRLQTAQYGMMRSERMAAVGTLASSLAHEVRNPLNSINLQLVLLSRRVTRLPPEEQSELAALIEASRHEISRLDGLVEEFLSLSSIDRLVRSEIDPAVVVHDVVLLLGPVARLKNVEMVVRIDGARPKLLIDREKLKQVLINLVRNAIEAMPSGGTLTLATRTAPGAFAIDVIDTGQGIEPGLDVFDFFMTTKRGGTGLGLPIARRIVEAHGGTLTYDSQPGRGTTFSINLKESRD